MIHDVTLVDQAPNKKEPNNPTYIYRDTNGDDIAFKSTNEPFVYQLVDNFTSPCYKGRKEILEAVADAFVTQGIKQHYYEGGFDEAIKVLTITY